MGGKRNYSMGVTLLEPQHILFRLAQYVIGKCMELRDSSRRVIDRYIVRISPFSGHSWHDAGIALAYDEPANGGRIMSGGSSSSCSLSTTERAPVQASSRQTAQLLNPPPFLFGNRDRRSPHRPRNSPDHRTSVAFFNLA
ncbi:hypothetical protein PMIN01_06002 [Paraphaeosphaeria minitans]|uniref:Uncharacterized protein n=1 Tax=Paraphaeosphaeria minitans TaxID=565426 RepID=A0A9P6KRD2_9PLEO|nr:hypothetical protein PMIN01_06002 [Paraphaeosphaeria minitans]